MTLQPGDFRTFYQAVHGVTPFPWQEELATRVVAEGTWPSAIDVPTGLGKTSVLDVAVFVAAATAGQPASTRAGRRRIFFVVDRRIVVDEVTEHARRIAGALADPSKTLASDVVGRVASALRGLGPSTGELLPVTRMRGGTTWDAAWLDRPDQPGIVVSTVDQFGSRYLFRGYGVSDRRKPIDAALTGMDSLLLVDEAHLAQALTSTVDASQRSDRSVLPLPGLEVVTMSATAPRLPKLPADSDMAANHVRVTNVRVERTQFKLNTEGHRHIPEAWRRLNAGKHMHLVLSTPRDIAKIMAQAAQDLIAVHAAEGAVPAAILIVCNTVDRARDVHTHLLTMKRKAKTDLHVDLLIGRTRPADRPRLQDEITRRYGLRVHDRDNPAILVATQTVEVGLNLDADALITESASWDAIVQRLGRLNRLGEHSDRHPALATSLALLVHDGTENGFVYGTSRDHAWEELMADSHPLKPAEIATMDWRSGVNVSPLACRALSDTMPSEVYRQPSDVPYLFTPFLDAWAQTGPLPLTDPDVAPFLHGFDNGQAPVQIAWRDGLLIDDSFVDPLDDAPAEVTRSHIEALLSAVPLRTEEFVEVPLVAALRWLRGEVPALVADLEGTIDPDEHDKPFAQPISFWKWVNPYGGRGAGQASAGSWLPIDPQQRQFKGQNGLLKPGDRIVVPSERGGLDEYGWNASSTQPVRDVGEFASFLGRRPRPVVRLDAGLPERLGLAPESAKAVRKALTEFRDLIRNEDASEKERDQTARKVMTAAASALPENSLTKANLTEWITHSTTVRVLADHGQARVAGEEPQTITYLLTGPLQTSMVATAAQMTASVEQDDEEEASSSISNGRVKLSQHHTNVGARAEQICRALGLPEEVSRVVVDAARWHDLGKIDVRFQAMLWGGDPMQALIALEPLAKSGMNPADRLGWRRAQRASRLPAGTRHEAWSAALVAQFVKDSTEPYPGDADLLIHLVASHHGHARPLLPTVLDDDPRPIKAELDGVPVVVDSAQTLSLEHPRRFAQLNQRYGRWGLALLESVVRCADMTVSAEGS